VAAIAFWFGAHSVDQPLPAPQRAKPATTVRLPEAKPALPAQQEVKLSPMPEIEPIVAPPMPIIEVAPPVKRQVEKEAAPARRITIAKPASEPSAKPVNAIPAQPWPVRVLDGSAGRLIRVGAFSTVHQAKRGWWAIVRVNPTLKRLPALVVPVRSLRNGRVYYRLQMGTTSQAHSTVLCQRMRMIAQPCVVIGQTAR
jgi:hypothetical protein